MERRKHWNTLYVNVLGLEKIRIETLDFTRMDPDQIKEVRPSSIVVFGKGAGLLNSPL